MKDEREIMASANCDNHWNNKVGSASSSGAESPVERYDADISSIKRRIDRWCWTSSLRRNS